MNQHRIFVPIIAVAAMFAAVLPAIAQNEEGPPLERITHQELLDAIAASDASLTVVNFWATWCVPCREEFPYFIELSRDLEDRGVDVVFVSMDFEDHYDPARSFLQKQGVRERSYLKTGKDHAFITAFSDDWSGAIPATFLYAPGGELVRFWEGKVSESALRSRVTDALADVNTPTN